MAEAYFYSSNAGAMTLVGGVTGDATSITISDVSGLPASTPFKLVLDPGLSTEEIVKVTTVAGPTLTVIRGWDGTTGLAHANSAAVRHMVTAEDLRLAREHEDSASGVHGLDGSVVGTSDSQTLTNKVLTDGTNQFPTSLARQADLDAHTGASVAHGVESELVGTTDTQTLTGKTISGATNTLSNVPQGAVVGLVADLGDLDTRLATLEADTGWVSLASQGITAAAGFTIVDGYIRKLFDTIVAIDASITTQNALAAGDMVNVAVLNLPAGWAAPFGNGRGFLGGGPNGGGHTAYVTTGTISLASTNTGYAAGATLNLAGVYIR